MINNKLQKSLDENKNLYQKQMVSLLISTPTSMGMGLIGNWLILGKEVNMENALIPVQLIYYLMGGLGLFFMGVGVLWFVSIYKEKNT